jgi:Autotransporter beta-domain
VCVDFRAKTAAQKPRIRVENLHYASSSATEIRGEVGARLDSRLAVNSDTTLILRGRGAYAYQTVNNPALLATFEAALAPGALPGSAVGFTVNGAVLPKNLALASAGAELTSRATGRWRLTSVASSAAARCSTPAPDR